MDCSFTIIIIIIIIIIAIIKCIYRYKICIINLFRFNLGNSFSLSLDEQIFLSVHLDPAS